MSKQGNRKDGFTKREPKEFEEEVIQIDRVTRVVKGGRKLRFRATVAIGNGKGSVGIGIGKSNEVTGAIQKAIAKAKKGLIKVPMHGNTIPHELNFKYKSAKLLMKPAAPGTGLKAGSTIRKVLELTGITDIISKSFGTKNKLNNAKCIYEALQMLRPNPAMLKKERMEREKKQTVAAQPPAAKPIPSEEPAETK